MTPQIIEQALRRSGATVMEEDGECIPSVHLTKADLCAAGLAGGKDSAQRRLELLKRLELPEHMSANALLAVLNGCYTPEEAKEILKND